MVPHHLVANEGQVTLKMDGFNSCVNGIGSLVQKLKTGFWGCLLSSSAYISYRSSTCGGTCHLLRLQIIIESHYHLPSLWLLSFRFYSQLECANSTTLSGWPREKSKKPTCFAMSVLMGFTWMYNVALPESIPLAVDGAYVSHGT